MSTRRPILLIVVATTALLVGGLLGAGAALAGVKPPSRVGPIATGVGSGGIDRTGVPAAIGMGTGAVTVGGTTVSGGASSGSAVAGSAVAYPYFVGTPGLAPDDTIVVTGVGQADIATDGSDRAAAEKAAIAAALADAKAQADAIATGIARTIASVLSVSASVSPDYPVMPMVANGTSKVVCPPAVAPMAGPGQGAATIPAPGCVPTYQQTLSVSLTVEYRLN